MYVSSSNYNPCLDLILNYSYYKCVRYERGCRGRAIFDPLDGFSHTNPHNGHLQDPHYPDEMALRRSILERCRSLEYTSFHQILGEERLR